MSRSGFTLLEVVISLVLAGLGVSLALSIFGVTIDTSDRLAMRAAARDRAANAAGWLAHALAGTEADGGMSFAGSPEKLEFHTSLWVSEGWLERSAVEVVRDGGRLIAHTSQGSGVVLADSVLRVDFDYLEAPGAVSAWLARWESDLLPPSAVRLRITRTDRRADTLLFFVGEKR